MNEPPLHLSFGVPKSKTLLPPGPLLSPGYLSAVKSASTGPGEFIQKRKGLCRRKSGNQTERGNKEKKALTDTPFIREFEYGQNQEGYCKNLGKKG
jgi:hypothetical protein